MSQQPTSWFDQVKSVADNPQLFAKVIDYIQREQQNDQRLRDRLRLKAEALLPNLQPKNPLRQTLQDFLITLDNRRGPLTIKDPDLGDLWLE